MRLALMMSVAVLAWSPLAMADSHCTCSQKCMTECSKNGGSKDCKCESCDCSKTGKCEHGKCNHEKDAKKETK